MNDMLLPLLLSWCLQIRTYASEFGYCEVGDTRHVNLSIPFVFCSLHRCKVSVG